MLKQFLSSAAALVAATSLSAQNLPETNDVANNTAAGAETAAVGAQHYGNISSSSDSDFWTFTTTGPTQINAWVTSRGPNGMTDPVILLHDASGDNVVGGALETVVGGVLTSLYPTMSFGTSTAGTWYIEILPFGAGDTGDYSFDLTLTTQATDDCLGLTEPPRDSLESEPNNSCGQGDTMPFCSIIREDLDTAGDVDFWCFTLSNTSLIQWETIFESASPNNRDDTRLWLYDSACNEIDTDDDGGAGFLSLLTATLDPGDYYLEVSDWQRALAGPYTLVVRGPNQILLPTGGTASSQITTDLKPRVDPCGGVYSNTGVDNEPNSTCAQANSSGNFIFGCTDTLGTIGMVGTGITDMWCFTVAQTTNIVFETILDSVLPGAYTDTKLWVYDSNCTEIAQDDDGGAGFLSRLERVYAPGTYYVECHDWQRAATGTFILRMTEFLPRPPACLSSAGGVTSMVLRENEKVQQGTPWTVDIRNSASPVGVVFLGFGPAALFPPTGLDLGFIGITNCSLHVLNAVATPAWSPGAGGDNEFSFGVGGLPVGLDIHYQAAYADFGAARALPVTTSDNSASGTVGDATFHFVP